MKAKLTALLALVFAVCITGSVMTYNFVKADDPASDGKKTITVAQYDFAYANALGKDKSANGNDLTAVGTPTQWTEDGQTGVSFDGYSVLYAAGSGEDKKGNDFADALVAEDFSLSLDFYVDSAMANLSDRLYRAPIFTLWGHMYTGEFDTNLGGSANSRAAALTVDWIQDGTTAHLRFAWPNLDGSGPDWGPLYSVSANAWHTIKLSWDKNTGVMTATMDGNAYFSSAAKEGSFVSNVARFTLGGYYTDPLNGGKGIEGGGKTAAFMGKIKNVNVERYELDGNKYNALADYALNDAANPGKANDPLFDLEKKGDGEITYDAEKGAMRLAKNAVLTAKKDADGYDFMDYMADGKLTVSAKFMIPNTYEGADAPADARNVLFSLWGLWWDGDSYNGGDADKMSSSVIYDAYASGAETVNLRIGFLYQDGDGTQNGWWSNKETAITTDEFHTITFAIDESKVTVVLDGAAKWSYDIAASHVYKSTNMNFTLGGAYGNLGVTGCNGPVYFKSFSIYDFAMSEAEMIRLQNGKLEVVSAGYIAEAKSTSKARSSARRSPT